MPTSNRKDFESSQRLRKNSQKIVPELIPVTHQVAPSSKCDSNTPPTGNKSFRWGNPDQNAAFLTLREGLDVTVEGSAASSLQAPVLNSSMQLRQRAIDLSSSIVSRGVMEEELKLEMQRMETNGEDESLGIKACAASSWKKDEEAFRDLVPVKEDKSEMVLRPKAVGKQIDRKWQSSLLLKPSFELFAEAIPDRQLRGAYIPPTPPVNMAPPPLDACSPTLATSFFDRPFSAGDLHVLHLPVQDQVIS